MTDYKYLDDFKLIKNAFSKYRMLSDDLTGYAQRYKNDYTFGVSYDAFGKKGSKVVIEDIYRTGLLYDISTALESQCKEVRIFYNPYNQFLEFRYSDYNFLATFFRKEIEYKNDVVLGMQMLSNAQSFEEIIGRINRFSKNLKLDMHSLGKIIPTENLFINWLRHMPHNVQKLFIEFRINRITVFYKYSSDELCINYLPDGEINIESLELNKATGNLMDIFRPMIRSKIYGFTKITAKDELWLEKIGRPNNSGFIETR